MKIATVPYMNALPLTRTLKHEISFHPPAELDRLLAEKQLDLATAPIATLFAHPELYVVSGVAIGANGAVKSVMLYFNDKTLNTDNIKYIYCDVESRTSVLLLKVLLAQRFDRNLSTLVFQSERDEKTQGELLIGDKALHDTDRPGMDLAKEWKRWTGLPFVFALWVTPHKTLPRSLIHELQACPQESLSQLDQWIAMTTSFDHDFLKEYLTKNVCYDLGPKQIESIQLFHQKLRELGLFAGRLSVHFVTGEADVMEKNRLTPIIEKIQRRERISKEEALILYHTADLPTLGKLANTLNEEKNAGRVGYLLDRNINYTNVCGLSCSFCAFYRKKKDSDAYVLNTETIAQKIRETLEQGGTGILLQGGHHSDLPLEWYEKMLRHIRDNFKIHIHAFSPSEIFHFSKLFRKTPKEILERFRAAGMQSLPGGGAEILVDRVRKHLSPGKVLADDWLEISATAHRLNLPSTATMMMGHIETPEERFEHLDKVRQIQDETHGFAAYIPWTYQKQNTALWKEHTEDGTEINSLSSQEYLRMVALCRIFLDNFTTIQASWLTVGLKLGQTALYYGANDMGSIMMEENVVSAAGASHASTEDDLKNVIRDAGKIPSQRNNIFQPV
jgi:cyclic dehypoxanthinyl futalosine synthase